MATDDPLTWYAGIGAKYLDLVGDYAGKEKFFIEGDSLLSECFSDPRLDFDPGFQQLHAVYSVEQYLSNLKKRGCTFDIVFFEDHSSLCVPPSSRHASKYLLVRSTVIEHLKNQAQDTHVLSFNSLDDVHFRHYLHESACYFALCSDGATYKYSKQKSLQLHYHATQIDSEKTSKNHTLEFRATIWKLMHEKNLDIALLNGLSWQDSKVFAFVLERNSKSKAIANKGPLNLNIFPVESFTELAIDDKHKKDTSYSRGILRSVELPESSRLAITISTLLSMTSDAPHKFMLPHILHVLCLELLPLSSRSLSVVDFPPEFEQELGDYMNEFEQELGDYMNEFCSLAKICVNVSNDAFDSTMIDLVDGRLLRVIIQNVSAVEEQLPVNLTTAFHSLVKSIGGPLEISGSFGNIRQISSFENSIINDDAVLPFCHPAFDDHLKSIYVKVDGREQHTSGRLALDLTHWHNSKMLQQPKTIRPRLEPREEKKVERAQDRFLTGLTRYAESLTESFGKGLDPKLVYVDQITKKPATSSSVRGNGGHPGQSNKPKKHKTFDSKPSKSGGPTQKPTVVKENKAAEKPLTSSSLMDCLAHKGPGLERSMDAQDDTRVPFKPDGWQIKVLDEIDQGNSLLVVAPTSAGKTFISFYAMEKALRASDDAVLVYVAPTKALVNQIAAEVLGKFKKNYKHAGPTVYSIFTRDYRIYNPVKAQILVTVPHLLQIMLMSPNNRDWVPRIKTIIFDEVHSVSQAEDGLIWEQLLVTAPSQIIALSATIGNTKEFCGWLSAATSATGREFSLIEHEHRYSDLRKYVYVSEGEDQDLKKGLPATAIASTATYGLDGTPSMKLIHPIASLLHPQRGMPPDLALESSDSLTLWNTMQKHATSAYTVPEALEPTRFFGSKQPLKFDTIQWSRELKTQLSYWMEHRDSSPYHEVITDLSQSLRSTPSNAAGIGGFQSTTDFDATSVDLLKSTMPMLCDLRARDALPAILFNYNRSACEDIVVKLLDQLVEAESAFKTKDRAWLSKMEKYTAWLKNAPAREKAAQREKGKGKAKNDVDRDDMGSKSSRAQFDDGLNDAFYQTFDPEAPLEQFSFANIKKSNGPALDSSVFHFKRVGVDDKLVHAFRRGIGVHHAGMNRWYRQAVEMFFRRGFLTVVVATGTLSLGINMPCKTVVFSGDSAFLTALNYRQASGRAGRRGFDLLGNVIFQELPTEKALRLISSKLPDINGHFPMTTVFVLRLLTLLHGTNNAPYAMAMVDALLSKPRLLTTGMEFKQQVLHHVRFSIEYLRSQGLLNSEGYPVGFASAVSHLYFVENSALAFHALLKEGYFHDLADEFVSNEEQTLKKLMLVLSNIFGRRLMRSVDTEEQMEMIRKSVSLVILPEMPSVAVEILNKHNERTLQTYRTYVSTFVEQHCKQPDVTLPFTGTIITPKLGEDRSVQLSGTHPAPKMRSPFAAMSGLTDRFTSISDLCDTVRGGVFLEKAVIPYLDMGEELATPLNAYLYDFFNNGSVKALREANRIPRGDLWFLLKDFELVLKTITTAIENFLNPKRNGDMDLAGEGDSEHDENEAQEDKDQNGEQMKETSTSDHAQGAADINASNESRSTSPVKKPINVSKPKKKKVVDSWDDESSSSEEETTEDGDGAEEDEARALAAAEQTERELTKVYRMFKTLQDEFEVKFRKIWA